MKLEYSLLTDIPSRQLRRNAKDIFYISVYLLRLRLSGIIFLANYLIAIVPMSHDT